MVASKRERIIGLLTAGVLAVLALDKLVLTPLMQRGADATAALEIATAEQEAATMLIDNRGRMERRWRTMLAGGIKADVPEAETYALESIRGFGEDAGVKFNTLNPDRSETREHFQVVYVSTSCTGTMRQISEFLWRVQTTQIPMRVTFMQVSSRRPGTDDLTLQLGVSTLCLAPPADPSKAAPSRGGRAGTSGASASGAVSANSLARGAMR